MTNSKNYAPMALLLIFFGAIALVAACGDDDDGGISLSDSDATETATPGTVPVDAVGTLPAEIGFAERFAELRAGIETTTGSSQLSDDPEVDELVVACDGRETDGEEQFSACIDLLELLVAQESDDLEPLITLTARHAGREFPDRLDEIDLAAGYDELPADDSPGTVPLGTNPGTVPIG